MGLPFLVVVCWVFVAGDNSGFNLEQHMNERDKEIAIAAGIYTNQSKMLETFADLIRADEREALIRYFDGHWRSDWSEGQIIEALEARGNP